MVISSFVICDGNDGNIIWYDDVQVAQLAVLKSSGLSSLRI